MPQLAPLLWLALFIFFCSILLMFTAMNYSVKPPVKAKVSEEMVKNPSFLWKW